MKTHMQATSMLAFQSVLPHMGMRQQEVYETLRKHGSMTNSEIAQHLGRAINVVVPRTKELRDMSLVVEDCRRECQVTHQKVISWKLAANTSF